MPGQRHTKESIITTLQSIAQQLGKTTLSKRETQAVVPASSINNHFGSLGNALAAAGLECAAPGSNLRDRGNIISDDDLFRSLLEVEVRIGHEPNSGENKAQGRYSAKPFKKRFGVWPDVMMYYRKWKADNPGLAELGMSPSGEALAAPASDVPNSATALPPVISRVQREPGQLYGEPIDFRGLRHAPANEQGVVYLFGMVSRELGFSVEAVQQGFPDCEAKYLYDRKSNLWARARIEFEFKASSFQIHGHDINQCDFIVCWESDWPDCPVTVIELRSEIRKLASR